MYKYQVQGYPQCQVLVMLTQAQNDRDIGGIYMPNSHSNNYEWEGKRRIFVVFIRIRRLGASNNTATETPI